MTWVTEDEFRPLFIGAVGRLGIRLRGLRVSRGLSQEQVAHDAGIAVQTYGCLERGTTPAGGFANPTLETILRVLHVLEVEAASLVGTTAPPAAAGQDTDSPAAEDSPGERNGRPQTVSRVNLGQLGVCRSEFGVSPDVGGVTDALARALPDPAS